MTNSFSFSRFGSYAASEFGSSLRQLLILLGLSFGIGLVAYCLFGIQVLSGNASSQQALSAFYMGQGVTMCGAVIFVLRNISTSFRLYHNPLSAPRMMLLPVAMSEKFTYAFLRNMILIPALLFGVWYLVRFIFLAIFDLSAFQQITEQIFESMQRDSTAVILERVSQVLTYICVALLFFMCSVTFRSRQFLWALIIITVIALTISAATVLYVKYLADLQATPSVDHIGMHITRTICICTILALIAAALFCVSWRKFKRLQVR